MPDSIRRITIAACTDDLHCAVDLTLPAGVRIGQLLPQIIDIVRGDTASTMSARDWRLSRLGNYAMDESMTLVDNGVRDGEMLILTTIEPSPAEWTDCDPCHVMTADASAARDPVPRILPAIFCVLLGGCGAVVLAWPGANIAITGRIAIGIGIATAAAVAAAVVQRRDGDPLACIPLSLIAVLYAGAVGYAIVPPGPAASRLLLAGSAAFTTAILLLRLTDCGRTCLTTIATSNALVIAASAVATVARLGPAAGGAALATLSLAVLGVAPRIAMLLSGIGPSTPSIDAAPCHRTLTGLVVGASTAATLGAATAAAGLALCDVTFAAVVAMVLMLRARTHVDQTRRIGLAVTAVLTAMAGLAAAATAAPAHTHVVSVLAAVVGVAALSCLVSPPVTPIVVRTVQVVEYLALAAVIPLACWVGGVYGLARGMNLI